MKIPFYEVWENQADGIVRRIATVETEDEAREMMSQGRCRSWLKCEIPTHLYYETDD